MRECEREFVASASDAGCRLDHFLVAQIGDLSRSRLQELILQGKVLVNDIHGKPSLKLRGGDRIKIVGAASRPPLRAIAEDIPLDVVYEDTELAVINKPAGMMIHAGAGATADARNRGTLVNALLHRFNALSGVGGELRPGIVHRLDRNTSGLIVVAKTDKAHRRLAQEFARREVHKTYIALVHGWVRKDRGTVQSAISRDLVRRTRMTTRRGGGRAAVSHWQVRERIEGPYGKFTLMEVSIETGRTHQIRVHLASVGHPVVGDTLYGAPRDIRRAVDVQRLAGAVLDTRSRPPCARAAPLKNSAPEPAPDGQTDSIALARNFLHAADIVFVHPQTGEKLHLAAPVPPELQAFLEKVAQSERSSRDPKDGKSSRTDIIEKTP